MNDGKIEYPLVSIILIAYKQEKYIRESVRSAFAQTYTPLEIILSDDCSPDGTFEVMQQMASEYKGPHKVILNRNPANLGLAGNCNRAWELSKGEFVVASAGDDISLPNRVKCLVEHWLKTERKVDLVCSYFEEICEQGNPTGYIKKEVVYTPNTLHKVSQWKCGATGACASYSRKLYDKYGELDSKVHSEDWVFSFRAWLEGGIALVEEPLVQHRTHSDSISMKVKGLKKLKSRHERFLQRKVNQVGSLGIAEEWLKAWRVKHGNCQKHDEHKLMKLVEIRKYQLKIFDVGILEKIAICFQVACLDGIISALKLFVRHVIKVY